MKQPERSYGYYGYICSPVEGLLAEDGTTLYEQVAQKMGLSRSPVDQLSEGIKQGYGFVIQDVTTKGSSRRVYVAVAGPKFNELIGEVDRLSGGKLHLNHQDKTPNTFTPNSIEELPAPNPNCPMAEK